MSTTPEAPLIECLRQRRAFNSTDGVRWYMVDEPDGDCQRAADEIERLTAERDALRADAADAERYRKLVASGNYSAAMIGGGWGLSCGGARWTKAELDAAADALPPIDAARAALARKGE